MTAGLALGSVGEAPFVVTGFTFMLLASGSVSETLSRLSDC
jgi:hypothetical protein